MGGDGGGGVAAGPALRDQRTLVEHWDGSSWTKVASPSPHHVAELAGVSAITGKNPWLVGWDDVPISGTWCSSSMGQAGRSLTVRSPTPMSLACSKGSMQIARTVRMTPGLWATPFQKDVYKTWVEHWDGTSWVKS